MMLSFVYGVACASFSYSNQSNQKNPPCPPVRILSPIGLGFLLGTPPIVPASLFLLPRFATGAADICTIAAGASTVDRAETDWEEERRAELGGLRGPALMGEVKVGEAGRVEERERAWAVEEGTPATGGDACPFPNLPCDIVVRSVSTRTGIHHLI